MLATLAPPCREPVGPQSPLLVRGLALVAVAALCFVSLATH